jgi:hypothetical protein
MIVFAVMLAGILVARLAGWLGFSALDDWHAATRAGLALMFIFTGTAHFTRTRADLVRMVPPTLPYPDALGDADGRRRVGRSGRSRCAAACSLGRLCADRAARGDLSGQYPRRADRSHDRRPATHAICCAVAATGVMDWPFVVVGTLGLIFRRAYTSKMSIPRSRPCKGSRPGVGRYSWAM